MHLESKCLGLISFDAFFKNLNYLDPCGIGSLSEVISGKQNQVPPKSAPIAGQCLKKSLKCFRELPIELSIAQGKEAIEDFFVH